MASNKKIIFRFFDQFIHTVMNDHGVCVKVDAMISFYMLIEIKPLLPDVWLEPITIIFIFYLLCCTTDNLYFGIINL